MFCPGICAVSTCHRFLTLCPKLLSLFRSGIDGPTFWGMPNPPHLLPLLAPHSSPCQ